MAVGARSRPSRIHLALGPLPGVPTKRAGGFHTTGPRERGVSIELPGCCTARKVRHLSMELTCATDAWSIAGSKIALSSPAPEAERLPFFGFAGLLRGGYDSAVMVKAPIRAHEPFTK